MLRREGTFQLKAQIYSRYPATRLRRIPAQPTNTALRRYWLSVPITPRADHALDWREDPWLGQDFYRNIDRSAIWRFEPGRDPRCTAGGQRTSEKALVAAIAGLAPSQIAAPELRATAHARHGFRRSRGTSALNSSSHRTRASSSFRFPTAFVSDSVLSRWKKGSSFSSSTMRLKAADGCTVPRAFATHAFAPGSVLDNKASNTAPLSFRSEV